VDCIQADVMAGGVGGCTDVRQQNR